MNTKLIIGAVAVIIVLVVAGAWVSQSQQASKDAMMKVEDEKMMEGDAMEKKDSHTDTAMEKDTMESDKMMKDDAMQKDSEAMMEKDAMMQKGGYEDYEASKVAFAKTGKVVLFFHASWCPTCIALDKDLTASAATIPADTLILDVDYDTAKDLRAQYGVTQQHTLVQVDASGAELKKWIGSPTTASVLSEVQ